MSRTYLEYHDDQSAKFWEITLEASSFSTRYGRVGASGQSSTKQFDSRADARHEALKLILAKQKKGYAPITRIPDPTPKHELRQTYLAEQEPYIAPMMDMAQSATLYKGDVTLTSSYLLDLVPDIASQGNLIVIDGDLTCTAEETHWHNRGDFSNDVLLVTGDLLVRNLALNEVGYVIVLGDLHAQNIHVSYGDNGGALEVHGDLGADAVIATTYFIISVGGELHVEHIFGDGTYASDFAPEEEVIDMYDAQERFVPEVIEDEDEGAEGELIYERLKQNLPVFRKTP